MVAPNGARRTKADHPAIPIAPDELAETAAACLDAGAGAIHLHVRDDALKHVLDAARNRAAIAAVSGRVGDRMAIQVTTEAVGRYTPAEQMALVRELTPDAVSIAVRELFAEGEAEPARFLEWTARERVAVQHILYDAEDMKRFAALMRAGTIPVERPRCILVLGRYTENQESDPADLDPLLAAAEAEGVLDRIVWSVCAFGRGETASLAAAIAKGGHARVGFENSLWEPDGTLAPDNAARVARIAAIAREAGRDVAFGAEARAVLGIER